MFTLDPQKHCHPRAYSWVYHRVDTQGDYTKTETSKVYQLQTHRRTHTLLILTHTHTHAKKALILQRRWALSTAQNTHTEIRKLELLLTISPSLCFNSPHLYQRELAPCVLSFRLCKVNKTLFTSKTKFLNFLIHNPALDTVVCQAMFRSHGNILRCCDSLGVEIQYTTQAAGYSISAETPVSCSIIMKDNY